MVILTMMLTVTKLVVQTQVSLVDRIIMITVEIRLVIPNLDCLVDTTTMIAMVIKLVTVTLVGSEIINTIKNNVKSRHFIVAALLFTYVYNR